jgi:uncharacterized protein YceH (UPF0502 family)
LRDLWRKGRLSVKLPNYRLQQEKRIHHWRSAVEASRNFSKDRRAQGHAAQKAVDNAVKALDIEIASQQERCRI